MTSEIHTVASGANIATPDASRGAAAAPTPSGSQWPPLADEHGKLNNMQVQQVPPSDAAHALLGNMSPEGRRAVTDALGDMARTIDSRTVQVIQDMNTKLETLQEANEFFNFVKLLPQQMAKASAGAGAPTVEELTRQLIQKKSA